MLTADLVIYQRITVIKHDSKKKMKYDIMNLLFSG